MMNFLVNVFLIMVGCALGCWLFYWCKPFLSKPQGRPRSDSIEDEIRTEEEKRLSQFIADLKRIPETNKKFYADANKLIEFVTRSMQLLGLSEIHGGLYSLISSGCERGLKSGDVVLCVKPHDQTTHHCLTDAINDDGLLNQSFHKDFSGADDYQQAIWGHLQFFISDFSGIISILKDYQEQLLTEVPKVDLDCFKESE